jgi:hypothetical protein
VSLLLVGAALVTSCVGPHGQALEARYAQLPDKELWFSLLLAGAFNELRCNGLDPQQARTTYEVRFGARTRAVEAAMLAKYGPLKDGEGEFLPVGKKCAAYRAAIRRSDAILTELERRLKRRSHPTRSLGQRKLDGRSAYQGLDWP